MAATTTDPNKLRPFFLPGTVLKKGASSLTVRLLHNELTSLGKSGQLHAKINYFEYKHMRFGESTQAALREYSGCDEASADTWRSLGLPVGETWQDMFASKITDKLTPTVILELKFNTATIKWRPRFIVYEYLTRGFKKKLSPDSRIFADCVSSALAGVLRWDSRIAPNPNPVNIHGVNGRVDVEIYDKELKLYSPDSDFGSYRFDAKNYYDSNVAVSIGKPGGAIVWDSFGWRGSKRLRVKIKNKSPEISRTMEHEFGHVLGLFDAYGYAKKSDPPDGCYHYGGHPWPCGLLPPAFIDGDMLRRDSVMVCDYAASGGPSRPCRQFIRTNLDYEMVLLAWRDNRLQLFTDSLLGKRSQAFYH